MVNNEIATLRTSLQSTAANEELQQRFATADQGMQAMIQKIDAASQATEATLNVFATVVAADDANGSNRKREITESKPINKLKA